MWFRIEQYDEITSTNDIVKQAIADGEPEGLVVHALAQTSGYGRRGNKWSSEPGGMYVSLLLRPEKTAEEIATLSLTTAIAVRRAIASFLPEADGDDIKMKWPNDVVVMRKGDAETAKFQKICGISLEQKRGAVCVGVGINVVLPNSSATRSGGMEAGEEEDVRRGLRYSRNVPVFLHELVALPEKPSVVNVRDEFLMQFADVYEEWERCGFGGFREEFLSHFALDGFKIRVDETGDSRPVRCEVRDVNELGHLIVLSEGSPELREISAGTVSIIERERE